MNGPIRDFTLTAWLCIALGALGVLMAIAGWQAGDMRGDLAQLGVELPGWFPTALFAHPRSQAAAQGLSHALLVVVGTALLRRTRWSVPLLRASAWLFLAGTLVAGAWVMAAVGPVGSQDDAVSVGMRFAFLWGTAVSTLLAAGAIGWFLWRLRGAG